MVPNFQQKPYTGEMTLSIHIHRKFFTHAKSIVAETSPLIHLDGVLTQDLSGSFSPYCLLKNFFRVWRRFYEICGLKTFLCVSILLSSTLVFADNKFSFQNRIPSEEKVFSENKTSGQGTVSGGQNEKKENKFQLLPVDVFFQPGGGVRLRYDYLDAVNSSFPQNRGISEMSHRAQMDLKLYKGEYIETFFRMIYFSEKETNPSVEGQAVSSPHSGLTVNQAWAFWKIDNSFGLRFGRLPIHIGLGYTYGSNDWFNIPYSFDLVDLIWDWESISVSLMAAKVADIGNQNPRFQGFRENERHIVMSLDIQNLFKTLDIFNLSFVQVNRDPNYHQKNKSVSNGLNVQRFGLETEIRGRYFFGSMFFSHVIGEEKMAETNRIDNEAKQEVSQSAFDFKLGYHFMDFNDLKLWLGYHQDTGDKSPTDKSSRGFDSFYYEVYGQSGFMDFIRWGNLSFLKAGIDMNIKKDWLLGMEWLGFSRMENSDIIHFGQSAGTLNTDIQTGDVTLGPGNTIGSELDLFTNLEFGSGVHIRTTVSAFLPGRIFKETTAVPPSGAFPRSAIYQCLTQIGYFF